jgi:XTP/dITP diphosphohydrolase
MVDTENSLLFGTRNEHKYQECIDILEGEDFFDERSTWSSVADWHERLPDPNEEGDRFIDNAFKKATVYSEAAACTTIADDSGLVVDALDGRPGVQSSRFAGPDATDEQNNEKLLDELDGLPANQRTAEFVCVVALAIPGDLLGRRLVGRAGVTWEAVGVGRPQQQGVMTRIEDRVLVWFQGSVSGRILTEPRGEGGFGYDPLFLVSDRDKTMAELPASEKNQISHRAKALRKMANLYKL